MKIMILFFITTISVVASDYDYKTIIKAQNAYIKQDYKSALKLYNSLATKDDKIEYNIANTYYRLKEYKKAIKHYKMVKNTNMQSRVLYNIGNCYAALEDYKKASAFFKSSLKYQKSQEAKFNLKMAKELLKSKVTQKLCKVTNPFKSNIERELKDFDNEKFFKDLKEAKYKPFEIKNNLSKNINSVKSDTIEPSKYKKQHINKKKTRSITQEYKEQKIDKKFKNRELKTLLIPIVKEEKNDN